MKNACRLLSAAAVSALTLFFANSAAAYEFKCEPWGTDQARCMARKAGHETEISAFLVAKAKQKVSFLAEGFFSACGSPGKNQLSQRYDVEKDAETRLHYTLGPHGYGCFEIFLSECKTDGKVANCYKSFTFEAPR